jgi:hypothetical protein
MWNSCGQSADLVVREVLELVLQVGEERAAEPGGAHPVEVPRTPEDTRDAPHEAERGRALELVVAELEQPLRPADDLLEALEDLHEEIPVDALAEPGQLVERDRQPFDEPLMGDAALVQAVEGHAQGATGNLVHRRIP